mmetsp:Transcript_16381/g.48817  ORF Transcript_16381/g.48817 Transcript_16381/m.48817 type:complete len:104 (-) Transcript_16381:1037-1348(-)
MDTSGAASASAADAAAAATAAAMRGSGEERFNDAYEKALLRKRLFKEYLTRHQVIERVNHAIEALYESSTLPEDPFPFLVDQIKVPPKPGRPRPSSATFRRLK